MNIPGLLLVMIIGACSCKNDAGDQPTFKDSFPGFNEEKALQLPPGTRLDTFKSNDQKNNADIQLILPGFDTSISFISQKIAAFIDTTKTLFYDRISYEKQEEDRFGGVMGIEPVMLYRSEDRISIILRSYFHTASMMRHFWTYCTINYNLHTQKEIGFNDYFRPATDSSFWPRIINASVGLRESWGIPTGSNDFRDMKFGFDEKNVYFCFDMFELNSIPMMGAVNKKVVEGELR